VIKIGSFNLHMAGTIESGCLSVCGKKKSHVFQEFKSTDMLELFQVLKWIRSLRNPADSTGLVKG